MEKIKEVLVFGDIMLDRFIRGSVDRISPEAPIPVLLKKNTTDKLGGAANVALNLVKLGVPTTLVGMIAKDEAAETIKYLSDQEGINHAFIQREDYTTTTKTRFLAQNHQLLRLDDEVSLKLDDTILTSVQDVFNRFEGQLIIISDYNKGMCQPEICQWIIDNANKKDIKVLVDPKINDWYKFKGAYIIKPNLKELKDYLEMDISNNHQEIYTEAKKIIEDLDLHSVVVTRGGNGVSVIGKDAQFELAAHQVDVYDVTGAGDTFIATLAFMLANGSTLEEAVESSNYASSIAVSHPNTYAVSKEELADYIHG